MRLAVCDDDAGILAGLGRMISGMPCAGELELSLFSDADGLLAACRKNQFDMIFMDIMLGTENGIEAAKKVAEILQDVRIVFVTAHVLDFAEHIFDGIRPYGYIGKPFDESRVRLFVDRAMRELGANERVLSVSRRGMEHRLLLSGVRYIESSGRQAFIHYADEILGIYERLDVLSGQLDDRFVRCHQSYIVNLDYVTAMQTDAFTVEDRNGGGEPCSAHVRISRSYIQEARRKYFEYKGRAMI